MSDWSSPVDKRDLADRFSKAAGDYDRLARVQQQVGGELLALLPDAHFERGLDLGCGTGYCTRALAQRYGAGQGLAVDLAEGMLRHARPLGGAAGGVSD